MLGRTGVRAAPGTGVSAAVRRALGMRVYEKPLWTRCIESWQSDFPVEHRWEGMDGKEKTLRSKGISFRHVNQSREDKFFKKREIENPMRDLEPEYYEKLPKWLRADGMIAPIEIAKIIMYLMMPVFTIVLFGSRNTEFVEWAASYFGDYELRATSLSFEEQVRQMHKVDDEGVQQRFFGLFWKRDKEGAYGKLRSDADQELVVEEPTATSEYFRVMKELREERELSDAKRREVASEMLDVLKEAKKQGLYVHASGQREMAPTSG